MIEGIDSLDRIVFEEPKIGLDISLAFW